MAKALVAFPNCKFSGGAIVSYYFVSVDTGVQWVSSRNWDFTISVAANLTAIKTQIIADAAALGVTLVSGDINFLQTPSLDAVLAPRSVLAFGGLIGVATNSMVRYGNGIDTALGVDAMSARIEMVATAVLENLRVRRANAPGAGNGNSYTIRKSGVDTAVT